MNSSSILKKTLPIVLIILLIVIIGITVTAVKAGNSKEAVISDADGEYLTITETINGVDYKYTVSRQELYNELKYGIGLSSIVTMVNKDILKTAKNGDGVTFWDLVTDEEITEAINKACYGEDVDVTDLSSEEKTKLEKKFLNTMYTGYGYNVNNGIYSQEIKDHYNLTLAKTAYAKYALKKAIADADKSDPYFSDDKVEEYYDDNYNDSYWSLIVPFTSTTNAALALQQLGVGIKEGSSSSDSDQWVHLTLTEDTDINGNGLGTYTKTLGDPLTTQEVISTFIKLYNMVYGYKLEDLVQGTYELKVDADGNNYYELSEGCDYIIADATAEVSAVNTIFDSIKTEIDKDSFDVSVVNPLIENAKTAVTTLKGKVVDVTGLEKILTLLDTLYTACNPGDEEIEDTPTVVLASIVTIMGAYEEKTYIFNTDNTESKLYYDYATLYKYDSKLPSKLENDLVSYSPYTSVNDDDQAWYTASTISSSPVYYFVLKVNLEEPAKMADVTDEIIDKLSEEEVTDTFIETKMAELREEYNIVIYDQDIQDNYITAVDKYDVTHKKNRKRSDTLIAKISNDDANLDISYTADDLFKYMEKTSGISTAITDIAYQRLINSTLFNVYKNMETGKWLGDDGETLKENIMAQIENQRLYFLSGSYSSYGYDPSSMSWEDFMYQINGAKDEYELADLLLYGEISSDYIDKAIDFISTVGDGIDLSFVQSYTEASTSTIWQLIQDRMQEIVDDYFSVNGVHLLVSMYATVNDYANSGTQIDPSKWSDESKALAKELIEKVTLYLEYADGSYADKLQAVVTAYNAAPYAVKDGENYVIAIDSDGELCDYVLTYADLTIDMSKYKSAGLYLKYESLGTFTNGKMVEKFEEAVRSIWAKDMADGVTDRITIYDQAIETEYGYHLYVNLSSSEITKHDSYVVDANGNLLDADGNIISIEIATSDDEDVKVDADTVKSVLPSLFEIRAYAFKTSLSAIDTTDMSDDDKKTITNLIAQYTALLTTDITTALETYYDVITKEITGDYFTALLQQGDIAKLFDSAIINGPNEFTSADLKAMIQANTDSIYTDSLTYLKAGDEEKFDITAIYVKEAKDGE